MALRRCRRLSHPPAGNPAEDGRVTAGEIVTGFSYLVGAGVFFLAARRKRLATEGMAVLAGVGFVSGILGAKLVQAFAEGQPASVIAPGGRALLGGLAFGWLGVVIAKRAMGIHRPTGDLFALALPAGEAVGRIGCHLNGCCYGIRCDLPGSVWQHGAERFPAQLLSSFTAASIFGFLLWLSPRLQREGDLFRVYLLLFGVTRFGLELVRWHDSTMYGLTHMQWFCLELVVVATVGLVRKNQQGLSQFRPGTSRTR
ncbi:hypothetical protein EON79_18205 [bacterium]|nr:MAG: hypothetical protein EON79_18205 [bacterium]